MKDAHLTIRTTKEIKRDLELAALNQSIEAGKRITMTDIIESFVKNILKNK